MVNWHVRSRTINAVLESHRSNQICDVLDIPGIGLVTRSAAIDLAAQIVLLAEGNLVKKADNVKVVAWNFRGDFFKAYESLALGVAKFAGE